MIIRVLAFKQLGYKIKDSQNKPRKGDQNGFLRDVDLVHFHGLDLEDVVKQDQHLKSSDHVSHVVSRVVQPVFDVV